jgi:hypothetical protein
VVQDNSTKGAAQAQVQGLAEDRVVPFRAITNFRSNAMDRDTAEARTKFGLAIAASILIGAFFKLIALALFLIAVLLIVSGKEPQKTREFLAGVPGGNYVIKALARVDEWIS